MQQDYAVFWFLFWLYLLISLGFNIHYLILWYWYKLHKLKLHNAHISYCYLIASLFSQVPIFGYSTIYSLGVLTPTWLLCHLINAFMFFSIEFLCWMVALSEWDCVDWMHSTWVWLKRGECGWTSNLIFANINHLNYYQVDGDSSFDKFPFYTSFKIYSEYCT